jgi:hypothetical protein
VHCRLPGLPDDGPGVPMNVVSMNHVQLAAKGGLSVLSLQFEVVDDRPDWPAVRVLSMVRTLLLLSPLAGAASTRRRYLALAHRCSLQIRDGAWRCTAAPAGSPGAVSSLP